MNEWVISWKLVYHSFKHLLLHKINILFFFRSFISFMIVLAFTLERYQWIIASCQQLNKVGLELLAKVILDEAKAFLNTHLHKESYYKIYKNLRLFRQILTNIWMLESTGDLVIQVESFFNNLTIAHIDILHFCF